MQVIGEIANPKTKRRSEHKAQTESGTNQTHAFGSVFFSGDIRNIGLGNSNIGIAKACDNAADKKPN
ncbi:MAG: hypothetical protein BWY75_02423 [bacterium ADurb.Bin425]|nr:MAG: hypothetical protein BWY75_02423 [bacterium ADurb.Bin425]